MKKQIKLIIFSLILSFILACILCSCSNNQKVIKGKIIEESEKHFTSSRIDGTYYLVKTENCNEKLIYIVPPMELDPLNINYKGEFIIDKFFYCNSISDEITSYQYINGKLVKIEINVYELKGFRRL